MRAYRNVASTFKGTDVAALRRADLIDKGLMHLTRTRPSRRPTAWPRRRPSGTRCAPRSTRRWPREPAEAEALSPRRSTTRRVAPENLVFWRRSRRTAAGSAWPRTLAPDLAKDAQIKTRRAPAVYAATRAGCRSRSNPGVRRSGTSSTRGTLRLATRAFKNKGMPTARCRVVAFVHRPRDEPWQYAVGRSLGGDSGRLQRTAHAETRFPRSPPPAVARARARTS